MSAGTQDGNRIIKDLMDQAKARPEAADPSPGGLGQLVAGVEYVLAGKPIREGSPHSLQSRVSRLKDWLETHPLAEPT